MNVAYRTTTVRLSSIIDLYVQYMEHKASERYSITK